MRLTFTEIAWEDYQYWQQTDKKMVRKINELINSIRRSPFEGIGKPEALKYDLVGFWSRRIDQQHRLIYKITEQEIVVVACRYHYEA